MREPTNLPTELIDLIFDKLAEQCLVQGSESSLWAYPSSHPIKAFGNACSSFRKRSHSLLWNNFKIDEGTTLDESWKLYAYLRCVDAGALSRTREFTYESYLVTNSGGAPHEVREVIYDEWNIQSDEEAASGMPLREDGSLDVPDDAPLVELADVAALGKLNTESDVWALLRFIFSRLTSVEKFCWRAWLDIDARFRGVSLAETIAALPKCELQLEILQTLAATYHCYHFSKIS